MSGVLRVTARWSGAIGLPGYSVFHFRDFSANNEPTQEMADNAVVKVGAFFQAFQNYLPNVVNVAVQGDVPIIEDSTGQMVDVLSTTPPASTQGAAGATDSYAAAVGAVVTWRTGAVRNGRIVRGRTFMVPMSRSAFEPNGTLSSIFLTVANNAATALRDGSGVGDLGVYARPTAPGAADGQWQFVTGHTIPDMGAVLRSRRD
jgi:hypothetical protein